MSELTVATRYAKSLIDLAEEQKSLEAIKNDMDLFNKTLKANPQLQAVLRNPIVAHDKKIKILDGVFTGKVSNATVSFFKIMINKSRGEILYPTAKEFINLYDIKKKIITASVVSAAPLSEANKKEIIAELNKTVDGTIVLKTKVDPDLIGGFVLTVGDMQIDTSLANGLARLKHDFAERI